MTSPAELIQTFRFQVDLTIKDPLPKWPSALGKGAFSECSGLSLEADVKEYLEGGFNFGDRAHGDTLAAGRQFGKPR